MSKAYSKLCERQIKPIEFIDSWSGFFARPFKRGISLLAIDKRG
jgi:hypothetical protein